MREVFTMWRYKKMIVLVVFTAAIYGALLIPVNHFFSFPGVARFSPAYALPVVLGLLFGPAGAWGVALGSLLADLFGTFSLYSVTVAGGSFLLAYIPYKLWDRLFLLKDREIVIRRTTLGSILPNYLLVAVVGSMGHAFLLAWGSDVAGLVDFRQMALVYLLNNLVMAVLAGFILLVLLHGRFRRWGMLWLDLMKPEDVLSRSKYARTGSWLLFISVLAGFFGCLVASFLGFPLGVSILGSLSLAGILTGSVMIY